MTDTPLRLTGASIKKKLSDWDGYSTFLAVDESTGEEIALRALDLMSCGPPLRLAFLRSHEQMSRTDLPFMPSVGPLERDGDWLCYSRKYVPGEPLVAGIASKYDAKALLGLLISCLSELHSLSIFHGNLKPSNVLYDASANWLHMLDAGFWGHSYSGNKKNRPSAMFRGPEGRATGIWDVRTDFFAFGLLCVEFILGIKINKAALRAISSSDRDAAKIWLQAQDKTLDPVLGDVIIKATSPSSMERFQSCVELKEHLRPILGDVKAERATGRPHFDLCPEFVGREDKMNKLDRLMGQAMKKGIGIATVIGARGLGRSTVSEQFLAICKEKDLLAVRVWCSDKTLNPYCLLFELLRAIASKAPDRRTGHLSAAYKALKTDTSRLYKNLPDRKRESRRLERSASTGPGFEKALQALWYELRERFWVIVIDDAHKMLGPAVSLFISLVRKLEERIEKTNRVKGGLFLVLTAPDPKELRRTVGTGESSRKDRSIAVLSGLRESPWAETIELGYISENAAQRLVASVLGSETVLPKFTASLCGRFDCNPAGLV
ncbi:AAA family ATPase, partial [bacterium]|nr:AAA family ATPase [bacterium]